MILRLSRGCACVQRGRRDEPLVPARPPTLLGSRSPSALSRKGGSTAWVRRSLLILRSGSVTGARAHPSACTSGISRSSRSLPPQGSTREPCATLSELRLLQSFTTRRRPQSGSSICGASHEVLAPSAHEGPADPLLPGLPRPVRYAFRVSHPLDVLLPAGPPDPRGVGGARGVLPFRASSSRRSRRASRRSRPSWRWHRGVSIAGGPRAVRRPTPRRWGRGLGEPAFEAFAGPSSGLGASSERVTRGPDFHRGHGPLLSWGSRLSRVSRRRDLWWRRHRPPMRFGQPVFAGVSRTHADRRPCATECHSVSERVRGSRHGPTLLRF